MSGFRSFAFGDLQYQISKPKLNPDDGYYYQRVRHITRDGRVLGEFIQRSPKPDDETGMSDPERGFDLAYAFFNALATAATNPRNTLQFLVKLFANQLRDDLKYPEALAVGYQSWPGTDEPWDRSTLESDPNPRWAPGPLERRFPKNAPQPPERNGNRGQVQIGISLPGAPPHGGGFAEAVGLDPSNVGDYGRAVAPGGLSPLDWRPTRRPAAVYNGFGTLGKVPGATSYAIDDAYLRAGEELDRIAMANNGHFDIPMRGDMAGIHDDYTQKGRRSSQTLDDLHRELWRIAADNIADETPTIPGQLYPELRAKFAQAARNAGSDEHLAKAFRDTGDALDRMFGRSINPDHDQAWQQALITHRNARLRAANALSAEQEPAAGAGASPQWPNATGETTAFGLPQQDELVGTARQFGLPPRRPGMFGPGAAKFWNRPEMEPYEMKPPSAAAPAVTDEGPFGFGALAPPFPDSAPVAWPSHRTMTPAQLARRYLELTGQAQEPEDEQTDPWSLSPWYRRS